MQHPGAFAITDDTVEWRSSKTDTFHKMKKGSLAEATWITYSRSCQLRLRDEKGDTLRFDGFSKRDRDGVAQLLKADFGVSLADLPLSTRGAHWGSVEFDGPFVAFKVEDEADDGSAGAEKLGFELPMSSVSQVVLPNKNEVEIQFSDSGALDKEDEVLVNMRLWAPDSLTVGDKTFAARLHADLLEKAMIRGDAEGKAARVTLAERDTLFLTPRGRYKIQMYRDHLVLTGKTYTFQIYYKRLSKFFWLPRPGGVHSFFVIGLEEPLRMGAQHHNYLVLQIANEEASLRVNIPEDEAKAENIKLKSEMKGSLAKVVAKVFKGLTGKPVYINGAFKSAGGNAAIRCAINSNEGFLYPLDKSFVFVHKPALYIPFHDIVGVEFLRVEQSHGVGASRTCDLQVDIRSVGREKGRSIVFRSIDRGEFDGLVNFLKEQDLTIGNLAELPSAGARPARGERVRSAPGTYAEDAGDDEDDEEEDEDFEAPVASSSSDGEDSEDEGGAGSDAGSKAKKRKAKGGGPAAKRRSRRKGDGSGDDDDVGSLPEEEAPFESSSGSDSSDDDSSADSSDDSSDGAGAGAGAGDGSD